MRGGVLLEPQREDEERPSQLAHRIQTGVGLAISLIGLAAYLYLLGGMVWWLRFTAARLPADEAITAIDDKRLLVTGFKAMLFEFMILITLMLMAWAAWWIVRRLRRKEDDDGDRRRVHEHNPLAWAIVLFGICLGATLFVAALDYFSPLHDTVVGSTLLGGLVGGMVGAISGAFFDEGAGLRRKLDSPPILWAVSLFLGMVAFVFLAAPAGVVMIVIIAFAHLGGRLSRLPSVRNPVHLVPGVLILGTAFGFIAATYQATPPVTFARAVVSLKDGEPIIGGYIGETDDGILLAECAPDEKEPSMGRNPTLRIIPAKKVDTLHVGGIRYAFDHGKDPSLFDLARYFYKRDYLREFLPTVAVDPRQNKLACGLTEAVRIVDGAMVLKPSQPPRSQFFVYGKGQVTISGDDIIPAEGKVKGSSKISLRIFPQPWILRRALDTGRAEVEVSIHYESSHSFSRSRQAELSFSQANYIPNAR
jgi:hypothetical protein